MLLQTYLDNSLWKIVTLKLSITEGHLLFQVDLVDRNLAPHNRSSQCKQNICEYLRIILSELRKEQSTGRFWIPDCATRIPGILDNLPLRPKLSIIDQESREK